MGEIGIPRKDFLFVLKLWEINAILKGYNRRCRNMWSAVRWHAYRVMSAMPYVDLAGAGINSPVDLLKFPWDKKEVITEKEKKELEDILKRERERAREINNKSKGGDM